MWELAHKDGWAPKNCCFWTVLLEKTLESPVDCKEIKPVNPKGNQPWIFIRRTVAEAPILWPPDVKSQYLISVLINRGGLDTETQGKKATWGSELCCHKPGNNQSWGRGLEHSLPSSSQRECGPIHPLILDFQPPELWGNTFLFFSAASLWYLVTEATRNACRRVLSPTHIIPQLILTMVPWDVSLLFLHFIGAHLRLREVGPFSSRSPELVTPAFLSPVIPASGCCVTSRISLAAMLVLFLLPSCLPSLSVFPKGSSLSSHLLKVCTPSASARSSHTSRPLGFADRFLVSLLPGPSPELLTPDTLLGHPTGTQNGITDPTFNAEFPRRMAPRFRTQEGSLSLSCFYVPHPHPILVLNHCHFSFHQLHNRQAPVQSENGSSLSRNQGGRAVKRSNIQSFLITVFICSSMLF